MSINDDQAHYFRLKAGGSSKSVSGTFTGVASSSSLELLGDFNVLISGGIGTVSIERSFDDGSTWYILSKNTAGDPSTYTTAANAAFNGIGEEREKGILYRLTCSAYTSGTITYRISQ